MSEPYYRIGTASSELETILYDKTGLVDRLTAEAAVLATEGLQDGIPEISSIKTTHRFPFRTEFSPVMISANQFLSHDAATNHRFTIEYGGEFMARMYQAIDISAGTVAAHTVGDTITFAYCENFVSMLLSNTAFKVSTDTLYEFPGHMLFIWYSFLAPMASRPALTRCFHESCFDWRWIEGAGGMDLTAQYNRTTAGTVLCLQHPYAPLQAYELTHAAFTIYVPYNIFTMCNVRNAYPIVGVYSLQRYLEYTFTSSLINCVNVWGIAAGAGGLIDPTDATVVTWTATPAVTATRLLVEYFVVQKELQQMLAMNAHGFLIRQYFSDDETLTDKTLREISVTKIIESLYLLCRHEYNVTSTPVNSGVTQVTLTGGAVDTYHLIDPFFLPVDEKPINRITLSARGQVFYKDLDWDELSAVNQYIYTTPGLGTTYNHCLGLFTFAHFYMQDAHTSSYNSGYGPNLRLQWTINLFSSADPGRLNQVIQCLNMVLIYRGALTIRYT